jgi:hypothetical protein
MLELLHCHHPDSALILSLVLFLGGECKERMIILPQPNSITAAVVLCLCADVECTDTVLPVTYPKFAGMMEPGDTLYVGRYLVSGADQASLYLEVRYGGGEAARAGRVPGGLWWVRGTPKIGWEEARAGHVPGGLVMEWGARGGGAGGGGSGRSCAWRACGVKTASLQASRHS